MVREIDAGIITATVAELCIKANMALPDDIVRRIERAVVCESQPLAKSVMEDIKEKTADEIRKNKIQYSC